MVLVVLDIDHTIINTVSKNLCINKDWMNRFITFEIKNDNPSCNQLIFCRPQLFRFLDELYSIKGIKVGIFTAAEHKYANIIINHIFKNRKLEFLLTRKDFNMTLGTKDINYIRKILPEYSCTKIVIIDDNQSVKEFNKDDCFLIPVFQIFKEEDLDNNIHNDHTYFYRFNPDSEKDTYLMNALDWIKHT